MKHVIETYDEYIKTLNPEEWFKEEININENDYFVQTKSIKKGFTDRIITVKCPGFYNTHKMILHDDNLFNLNIKDEKNKEIDMTTRIFICHIRPSEFVNLLSRNFYDELKELEYKNISKHQHFSSLRGEDILTFTMLNSPVNIPKENIKFSMNTELWVKKEPIIEE